MKSYGLPIQYSRERQSYFYSHEVELDISFKIKEKGKKNIVGGHASKVPEVEEVLYREAIWKMG